ncbi:cysteine--tRNA ligase [Candidatus Micrarchaeota archaeon]|nr:cysteine--tRNA ligase [Candidatus Micrarchaeota archaeon]
MHILFYNSLSKRKEEFKPITKGRVGLYTCGPTVYNYAHIGNLRSFLFVDLLKRFLSSQRFAVTHVMNITDVDDKTINGSSAAGKSLKEFTLFYEEEFFKDCEMLGIEKPGKTPRATEHIKEMISLVQALLDKKIAYIAKDGVYYSISKFKNYGKLSGLILASLKQGASGRIQADEYDKESAQDFVLWKFWDEKDGSVFWEAPFGKGRPGWHLECSAMSVAYLGDNFDIHTGGVDLKFPHHENEIAQSEAVSGKPLANYWLHCEHLLVDGKKMAKRDNNFYTLRDLVSKGYSPYAIRYVLLSTHYRSQLNFTLDSLDAAENTVKKLQSFFNRLQTLKIKKKDSDLSIKIDEYREKFFAFLSDDLDVANALAVFFEFTREFNTAMDAGVVGPVAASEAQAFVFSFDKIFDLIDERGIQIPEEVEKIVEEREEAKKKKNFALADELRQKLREKGYAIEDSKEGIVIKRV